MNTLTWKFTHTQQKRKPLRTLETLEETLAFLNEPVPKSCEDVKWSTCSIPLMDFMDELEKGGFVYNTQAMRAFEAAHNLPKFDDNGSQLSLLVYNCQGYRRARKLELDGWEPCTTELLTLALQQKKRVVVEGEGAFGTVREGLTVRVWKHDGKPHAFRPRQHRPLNVGGLPCKLVA